MNPPSHAETLQTLALARGTVDRVTEKRSDRDWLDAAWRDPRTRVFVVSGGRALVRIDDERAELIFSSPAEAPPGIRLLLGQDPGGVVYFSVAADLPDPTSPGVPEGVRAASLREVGSLLGDRDAGLFTHAVALANWHDTHTHCPVDGTPTVAAPGGHSAICPKDGTEHFPRTDPAVIMLVTDPDDRCLLARNAAWPGRRVSILAGFVDPGESAEQAVVREVGEETGIKVTNVRYVGSQPWPMPRSLMLGFRADAPAGQAITVDHDELAEAHWFSRDELLAAVKAGEIALPPSVSIARHIIEAWYGAPLPPTTWPEPVPPGRLPQVTAACCLKRAYELRKRCIQSRNGSQKARISRAVNGETIKTDYQVEVCSEELAERGARVGKVFTDSSLSAWRRDVVRPDWIKLMGRLESGQCDGVMLTMSRASAARSVRASGWWRRPSAGCGCGR